MSCVAGLVYGDRVWMAGDSAATGSDASKVIVKNPKVFIRSNCLFGCVGSFRLLQLLRYEELGQLREEDPEIATELVAEWVRHIAKENDLLDSDGELHGNTSVMIGFAGRLFVIQQNFAVIESANRFDAIGITSASSAALGALSVLIKRPDFDPSHVLTQALEVASNHCVAVSPPFVIESI